MVNDVRYNNSRECITKSSGFFVTGKIQFRVLWNNNRKYHKCITVRIPNLNSAARQKMSWNISTCCIFADKGTWPQNAQLPIPVQTLKQRRLDQKNFWSKMYLWSPIFCQLYSKLPCKILKNLKRIYWLQTRRPQIKNEMVILTSKINVQKSKFLVLSKFR